LNRRAGFNQKKGWIGFILLAFLLSGFVPVKIPAHQNKMVQPQSKPVWITLDESWGSEAPRVELNAASTQQLSLAVTIGGLWAEAIPIENGMAVHLWGEKMGSFAQVGDPDLPVYRFEVEVPQGVEIKLDYQTGTESTLHLNDFGLPENVAVLQADEPKCDCTQKRFNFQSKTVKQAAEILPVVRMGAEYTFRGHRILTLEVQPLRLDGNQRLQAVSDFKIGLEFQPISSAQLAIQSKPKPSPVLDPFYQERVIHYQTPALQLSESNDKPAYLVICPAALRSALNPWVVWRESQGVSVKVIEPETTLSAESLLNLIKVEYQSGAAFDYLLLVGDTNYIPAGTGGKSLSASDLSYSTMDGPSDYVPDFLLGRLPARNPEQLTTLVANLLAYDQTPIQSDWAQKASYIAPCAENSTPYYAEVQQLHDQMAAERTAPYQYTGAFPQADQVGGDKLYCVQYSAGTKDLLNAFSDGRGLILYSGHGNERAWTAPYFSTTQVSQIEESGSHSFITSLACETGDYGVTTSLGEAWLLQAEAGAAGFLGSSAFTYWDEDNRLEEALYTAMLPEQAAPPLSMGALRYQGLAGVQIYFPGKAQYYWEAYNLLGDPGMPLQIAALPKFWLASDPQHLAGNPGTTLLFNVPVKNEGNLRLSFQAALTGNQWDAAVQNPLISLAPGETGVFRVEVQIPSAAPAGSRDEITLTGSMVEYPDHFQSVSLAAVALGNLQYLPMLLR